MRKTNKLGTFRPYKLEKGERKGLRLCDACRHLFHEEEMVHNRGGRGGITCVYCLNKKKEFGKKIEVDSRCV